MKTFALALGGGGARGLAHIAVVEAFDRRLRKAQQRRRFAAADLRPAGAHHEAVPAGLGRNLEQQVACGHHTGAAAARDRDRNAFLGLVFVF